MAATDLNQPVVIDNVRYLAAFLCVCCNRVLHHVDVRAGVLMPQGSGSIKAGFAGADLPKLHFPA